MKSDRVKIYKPQNACFPDCWLCGKPLRRPCSLKTKKLDKPKIVCVTCYRLYMNLSRMATYGLIEFKEDDE